MEEITNQVKGWDPSGRQGLRTDNPARQSGGKSLDAVVGVVNSDWSMEFGRSGIDCSLRTFSTKRSKEMGWTLEEEEVSSSRWEE